MRATNYNQGWKSTAWFSLSKEELITCQTPKFHTKEVIGDMGKLFSYHNKTTVLYMIANSVSCPETLIFNPQFKFSLKKI